MNKPGLGPATRLCSKSIRSRFLDYFSSQGHAVVRSSPVVPYCDSSIAFVNSGMCQFKNVFLGLSRAPHPRVTNSQKCIRVGGRHNDLASAGRDSTHHTFFEMLGNWSFNDYYKREACHMALDFLTKPPIALPLTRLYFTYFGGDEKLGLPCDEETRDIWLQLGVPRAQLKPDGVGSNFWEMGNTGPCGYSTEIHFDLKADPATALARVNVDGSDLIEIWNIVFICYNRVTADRLVPLSKNYVDTGLGFERMVTILQDKTSTYDTDLFQPLLHTIERTSGAPPYSGHFSPGPHSLDTGYRMLSDYARMITVALADNMFPDATAKLRNVLRDALVLSEDTFKVTQGKLLKELSYQVAEMLGETYPELRENINKVQVILAEESRVFDKLRNGAVKEWKALVKAQPELAPLNIMEEPGLVQSVQYLAKQKARDPTTHITGDMAFVLYDTFGLGRSTILALARVKQLSVDEKAFEERLEELKARSKEKSACGLSSVDPAALKDLPVTDDSFKYVYNYEKTSGSYTFPALACKLLAVILGDQVFSVEEASIRHAVSGAVVDSIQLQAHSWVGLVFDRTNFYVCAGGQIDDNGVAYLHNETDSTSAHDTVNDSGTETGKVEISELATREGRVVHFGYVVSPCLVTPGMRSRVRVDALLREGAMRAHTGSHLLTAAIQSVLTCTHQKSCRVSSDVFALDFSVYGETLSVANIATIESHINDVIARQVPVVRRQVSATELAALVHVTTIPGEVYPDDVTLIEIAEGNDLVSREPCCGTHVTNTAHLGSCTVLVHKSRNHGVRSMECVTGELSRFAKKNGNVFQSEAERLEATIKENLLDASEDRLAQNVQDLKALRQSLQMTTKDIPFVVDKQIDALVTELSKSIKLRLRELAKIRVSAELVNLTSKSRPYCVHVIRNDLIDLPDLPPLSDISRPLLVFLCSSGILKGRAYVPADCTSPDFTAFAWVSSVLGEREAKLFPNKGVDKGNLCNLHVSKPSRVVEKDVEELISNAEMLANEKCKKSSS